MASARRVCSVVIGSDSCGWEGSGAGSRPDGHGGERGAEKGSLRGQLPHVGIEGWDSAESAVAESAVALPDVRSLRVGQQLIIV